MTKGRNWLASLIFCVAAFCTSASAQTTEFIFQGNLKDTSIAANGNYDFEFRLYDAASGGTQVGQAISVPNLAVSEGIFSTKLDFGNVFPGADRYLEIRVRNAGAASFNILSPRQRVNSSPYSIKSLTSETAGNAATANSALNATNAISATNAVTAINFSGSLGGDVVGTQASTTVARLQGRSVANTAPTEGQVLKYNQTANQWQPGTVGAGSGGGTITGVTAGTGLTGGGTQGSVSLGIANGGVGTLQIADGSVTDGKISGVSGSKVTGTVANATNAVTATTATNATNFTGNLAGDVTGSQAATVVSTVGGQSAANIAAAAQSASAATSAAVPNTLVSRDGSGGFSAGIVNATQFNLLGERALATSGTNTTVGRVAGPPTSGTDNSYFGHHAGLNVTTGASNAYFGKSAGQANSTGNSNSFFGSNTGGNSVGSSNSFFGSTSGFSNTASANSFFGALSGYSNTSGNLNTFIGYSSGLANIVGSGNTLVGNSAGSDVTGSNNTFVGTSTGTGNQAGAGNTYIGHNAGDFNGNDNTAIGRNARTITDGISNAAAIGALARVDCSNCMVLGSVSGINSASSMINVGIGTTFPRARLHAVGGSDAEPGLGGYIIAGELGSLNLAIDNNEIMARDNGAAATLALNADGGHVNLIQGGTGNVGIGTATPLDKLHVDGIIRVATLGAAGSTSLCRNASSQLSTCSSSLRYKTNMNSFSLGLDLIRQLKPLTFDWKDGGLHDLGLGAEDVAAVEPLLVTYNAKGEVEGVKYDRIGVVLVNAVKEQQSIIEKQQKLLDDMAESAKVQQREINELKAVICALYAKAKVCRR